MRAHQHLQLVRKAAIFVLKLLFYKSLYNHHLNLAYNNWDKGKENFVFFILLVSQLG